MHPVPCGNDLLSGLKFLLYLIFVAGLFFFSSVKAQAIIALLVLISLAFLPNKKITHGLIPITMFIFFTFMGNVFFHSGKIIYEKWVFSITDEGLKMACIRTLRVFSMIGSAKAFTAVLTLEEMTACLAKILRPFEKAGVPVSRFFNIMGLTAKFFPVLSDYLLKEYRKDLSNNNIRGFRNRLRHLALFLMPVFVRTVVSPETFLAQEKDGTGD